MTATRRSCTLLVIDPCQETQTRIFEHVQGRGFSIITALDPASALATIDLTAPDIVITDLFLPDGSGLTLTKTLRARHAPCPVIVMAKDGTGPAVVQALRAGAVDYLHKPIGVEDLAHALQRARHMLPTGPAEIPGIRRSEYQLTTDSDPSHIPEIVSCLIKATGSTLPETQRLHLRGTLQELLFNAMEHGNLEISYQEKRQALVENRYTELIEQRLAQPRLKGRHVTIHVMLDNDEHRMRYRITDEGNGFEWNSHLSHSQDPCRSEDVNGRGIFLAQSFFPNLTYNDRGNEVTIMVPLD